ncbi:Mitochondrial intermediate peptidase [Frankliniella fusca]|uniref:Mitochondrial intermediate peptidase n=1 Tax=Frankliniella fusca TaxID=407009 RepID=A0AAE1LCL3_9NEOP|nr:Mitochondrial intermediate peptidase [Frankliniella fusca]
MSAFAAVLVLFACAAAAEGANNSAAEQRIRKAGDAIPAVLLQQWTATLTAQRKQVAALKDAVTKGQTQEIKGALDKAFAQLDTWLAKSNSLADALKKRQGEEVKNLVNKYITVLRKLETSQAAAVANEQQVQQVRKDKMALLTNWENHVIQINGEYRRGYVNAFKSVTQQAAGKKPAVRKALRAAFQRLLGTAVKGQEENIALLTTKQAPLVEQFALLAGKILIELVVAGQAAQI